MRGGGGCGRRAGRCEPRLPKTSIFEGGDGHDKYPVGPLVGRSRQAAEDTEDGGRTALVSGLHLAADAKQVFGRRVNLVCPQFDLKSAPGSVGEFYDCVNFLAAVILVVVEVPAEGFGVDAQIPIPRILQFQSHRFHNFNPTDFAISIPEIYSVRARSAMFWWKLMILCSYSSFMNFEVIMKSAVALLLAMGMS